MMNWSLFSPAHAMKTEEGQEKGDEGCQGIILHSTSTFVVSLDRKQYNM
mgnify:CR=1 FL=1